MQGPTMQGLTKSGKIYKYYNGLVLLTVNFDITIVAIFISFCI